MYRIFFVIALFSVAPGCKTFSSLAGFESPTVPPPATGSYTIPGSGGASKPYYSPATDGEAAAPGGGWLPVQSQTGGPSATSPAGLAHQSQVQTVSFEEASADSDEPASANEIINDIQKRLAEGRMQTADASGLQAPGTIPPSNSAQPLAYPPSTQPSSTNPPPTHMPVITQGQPTNPLSTPPFDLPSSSPPVGSGVMPAAQSSAPANSAIPGVPPTNQGAIAPASNNASQPTIVPSPLSVPAGGVPGGWTSSSNSTLPQPTQLPTNGAATSFRPRVRGN